jgi:hypothetical protein
VPVGYRPVEGASGTIALVLAEAAAGGTVLLWLGRVWGSVKRGFFVLTEAATLACALLATLAASSSAVDPPSPDVRVAVTLSAATSALIGISLAALILRLDRLGRVVGVMAAAASVAVLAGLARVSGEAFGPALIQLAAGAAFMGAVTDGLLLGHWYLVDRGLARDHIRRFAVILIIAVVLEAVAVAVLGFGSEPTVAEGFSPLLAISGTATWLALGMVACTGLIAFLIRASLRSDRSRAVQAATGFFYLAVITAFTAEVAAKVGFLD